MLWRVSGPDLYTDYEVILVNDGSTDDSGRLCEGVAMTMFITMPRPMVAIDARNYGVAKAPGRVGDLS